MRQAETKMKATELDAQLIGPDDACYIFDGLTNIAQGSDNEQRIGDKVNSTGLQIKWMLECQSANPFNYLVRIILIKVKDQEFSATTDNFLVNTANEPLAFTGNDNVDVLRSLNKKEYSVLWDKNFSISSQTSATGNSVGVRYGTRFFRLKDARFFAADANAYSAEGNLRLVIAVRDVGGDTVAAGNDIALTCHSRYYYKDL